MLKQPKETPPPHPVAGIPFLITFLLGGLAIFLVVPILDGTSPLEIITAPFGLSEQQLWWYVTRASGLTAYVLFWLSTMWGLAVSSKILDSFMDLNITLILHEILSLLGLGFSVLHAGVLLFDRFIPFSLAQILVPFISSYRPFWVGTGILCFYLALLVTITYYLRRWITQPVFRLIHVLSLFSYLGILFHALFAGTDSGIYTVLMFYRITFLFTVFFGVYWAVRQGRPADQVNEEE